MNKIIKLAKKFEEKLAQTNETSMQRLINDNNRLRTLNINLTAERDALLKKMESLAAERAALLKKLK